MKTSAQYKEELREWIQQHEVQDYPIFSFIDYKRPRDRSVRLILNDYKDPETAYVRSVYEDWIPARKIHGNIDEWWDNLYEEAKTLIGGPFQVHWRFNWRFYLFFYTPELSRDRVYSDAVFHPIIFDDEAGPTRPDTHDLDVLLTYTEDWGPRVPYRNVKKA